jgi:hypothetical protein
MENVHLSVIPAKAGIHWLQVLRDPCLRRDDGEEAFFDTLRDGGVEKCGNVLQCRQFGDSQ